MPFQLMWTLWYQIETAIIIMLLWFCNFNERNGKSFGGDGRKHEISFILTFK